MWPNPQFWSHLLKKSLMENLIFVQWTIFTLIKKNARELLVGNNEYTRFSPRFIAQKVSCYLIQILSFTQKFMSWLCIDMTCIMVSWHHVTIWLKRYPRNFCGMGSSGIFAVFLKAIFSCLNLRPDDGYAWGF